MEANPTLAPQLNPWFGLAFLAILLLFLAVELWGVYRKGKGDTFTEGWRWTQGKLNGLPRWLFRILTAGILIWALLHFLVGAD